MYLKTNLSHLYEDVQKVYQPVVPMTYSRVPNVTSMSPTNVHRTPNPHPSMLSVKICIRPLDEVAEADCVRKAATYC